MIEFIGLLGGIFLAFSALPQVLQSIKNGHSNGISSLMLFLWFFGVLLMLIYSSIKYSDIFLITNYILNLTFVSIIFFYKLFPRKK